MKNLFKLFVPMAAAVIALASCQQEQYNAKTTLEITVSAIPDEIKADPVSAPESEDVKTYISGNKIYWGEDEYMKIGVHGVSETTWATSDAMDNSLNGQYNEYYFTFTVTPKDEGPYTYYGLYPASAASTSDNTDPANYKVNLPSIQNASASSYDPAAYILVAKPEGGKTEANANWNAFFRRATALNKITLKNFASSVSINKVKITAEGKHLAGGHHINLTTGENCENNEYYNSAATIEVLFATPLSGTSMDVWFTSWDTEIAESEKLTIIAYTTDNKSYTKEITVPNGKSIKFEEGCLNTLGAKFDGIDPEIVASLDGDYVILAENNGTYYALKGEASGTRIASVNYTGSTSSYAGDASLVWTIAASGSGYTIKNGSNFIGWTSGNAADLVDEASYDDDQCLMGIDDNGDGTYKIYVAADATRILARNQSNAYFAFYTGSGYKDLILVPATVLEQVATPTFSPAAGEVTSGTEVTISTATSGATIYYTTDGSNPTTSSTQGTSVTITAATTVKAIAVKDGMANSEVATAQYTISGVIDYPTLETSDVTLTAGTNGSAATVDGEDAIKVGTSSKGGSMSVTVPAGTTKLHLHAAAWNGVTGLSLNISGATVSPASIALTADTGISGNSPFTLSGNPEDFYFVLDLSDIVADTEITFTSSIAKRFVVWGVNAETGASVTWNLESIAITTPPTKTVYTEGESFDSAGMVVTGHFVDADDNTNTKDEAVTGYTISPDGALSTSDDHVTITYQGQTANQSITVNAAATPNYDFETVAELNALVTSSSASYNGYLTDAVVSFVPTTGTAFVKDATGSVMIYKSNHGLLQGQTYTGEISVTAIKYNSLYSEITAWSGATFAGSQASVAPQSVSLADLTGHYDDFQNAYVSVSGLTVVSTSTSNDKINVNVTDGTNTYVVYDNTGSTTCGAGDIITAVGTITKYSTTEEIKVWAAADITVTGTAPKAITFSQPTGGAGDAGCSFTVTVGGSPITSGDTVASGATVTLTATEGTDYEFSSWTVNGATLADASANPASFTMGTAAVSISANFTSTGGGSSTPTLQYTLDGTVPGSGSAYAGNNQITQDGIGWIVNGNTQMNPWRIGGKSITSVDRALYSTTAIAANITQINVTSGATMSSLTVNSLTISVHNSASDALNGTNAIATKTVTSGIASSTVTFDKADNTSWAGKYYRIVYNVTRTSSSSNGYITFESATFYGTN